MGDYLSKHGIRFILVIAPEVIGFKDWSDYPHRDIHQKIRRLSSGSIEVVDPLNHISSSGHRPKDLWVAPYDCHKNAKANMSIGSYLAKYIEN